MKVRVSHPALVKDLVEFLGRARCETAGVHGAVFDVIVKLCTPLNVLSRSSVNWKSFSATSPTLRPSIRIVTEKLVPLGTMDVTCLVTARPGNSSVTPAVPGALRFCPAGVVAVPVA